MVDPQSSRFWQASLQSGLIDDAGLKTCWENLPPEKRGLDQLERRLARQAVQLGLLTVWQAQQLLAGRSTGFKINRYTLLEMIGQGGMGRVYLARDTRLNRRVALKILSPERVNNPRAIARFQREARVGAQLQHEHLVRIYDEGEAAGKCYLVMEYIEGKNIGSLIAQKGPLPPSTAARLTRQVALGLEHAQQKGLIHRDVNPYNILVTSDGTAKLTDLGLAIDLAEQVPVTREGATVGTFDYISPEQARHSHSVDTRSDIYSLGCSLYHMLAGTVPFPSPSLPEKLFGHQASEPESLASLVPGIPAGLEAVVRKMMRKQPDERYASPMEVAQALEPFVDESAPAYREEGLSAPRERDHPGSSGTTRSGTEVAETGRGEDLPVTQAYFPTAGARTPEPPILPLAEPKAPESSGLDLPLDLGPPPPGPKARPTEPPAQDAAPPLDFTNIGKEPAPKLDLSGLGLGIDLGPEPPLSGSPSKSKPRGPASSPPAPPQPQPPQSKTKAPPNPKEPPRTAGEAKPPSAPRRGRDRRLVLGGAAALLLVAAVGGLVASGVLVRPRPSRGAKAGAGTEGTRPSDGSASASKDSTKRAPEEDGPTPPAIAAKSSAGTGKGRPGEALDAGKTIFKVRAPDGTMAKEAGLKAAIQRAIGSRGTLLLDHRAPLRITGADAALRVTGGPLYIRAAPGTRPVLEVEIQGRKPFLTTGSETPVTLAGVTIVARYAESDQAPPPLIEAAGSVTLDRSAFSATGKVKGARVVHAEAGTVTATGCWFQGFDPALDIAAFSGSSITVRQCMLIWGRPETPPGGFALRVRTAPGGLARAGRRLRLDHCTVEGAGLLDLIDFSPQMPLQASVKGCAVLADALIAWEGPAPGTLPPGEALLWTGEGNQYELRGKSWVVSAPRDGVPIPGTPHDPASWARLARESAPIDPPISFQTPIADLSATPRPQDLAIKGSAESVGADPAQVGPAAGATRAALSR